MVPNLMGSSSSSSERGGASLGCLGGGGSGALGGFLRYSNLAMWAIFFPILLALNLDKRNPLIENISLGGPSTLKRWIS